MATGKEHSRYRNCSAGKRVFHYIKNRVITEVVIHILFIKTHLDYG